MNCKTRAFLLAFLATGMAVAEDVTLTTSENAPGAFSTNAERWTPNKAPASNDGQDVFIVSGNRNLTCNPVPDSNVSVNGYQHTLESRTFQGKRLVIDGGWIKSGVCSYKTEEDPSFETGVAGSGFYAACFGHDGLVIKSGGTEQHWYADRYYVFGGDVFFDMTAGNAFTFMSGVANPAAFQEYRFLGPVTGTEDADVRIRQRDDCAVFRVVFTNAVGYLGSLAPAGAGNGFTLNAARLKGLSLENGAHFTLKATEADNVVGTLVVTGSGRLNLIGEQAALTVTNAFSQTGTLTLDASQKPVIAAGTYPLLTLSADASGTLATDDITVVPPTSATLALTVVKSAKSVSVLATGAIAYDAENNVTVPADFTSMSAEEWASVSKPFAFRLSDSIRLPFSATNRLPVMTFAASVGVCTTDFVDQTGKTQDLPFTWVETATVGDVTTVYQVARPVIAAQAIPGHTGNYFMMEESGMWSDGELPHGGADYLVSGFSSLLDIEGSSATGGRRDVIFPGETLTIDGDCQFAINATSLKANFRFYRMGTGNNAGLWGYSAGDAILNGSIYVAADNTAFNIRPYVEKEEYGLTVESDIAGTGNVLLQNSWSASSFSNFKLYGDNSALTGELSFKGNYRSDVARFCDVRVSVTNVTALGGPMAAEDRKGLQFNFIPQLIVKESMTFDTLNRHLYAIGGFRLMTEEGVTFALKNPLYVHSYRHPVYVPVYDRFCAIEKTGPGVFALGAKIVPSNGNQQQSAADCTNNLVRVWEGGVQPLAADVFDNVLLDFRDGTEIVVDPSNPATGAYGLRALDCVPSFASDAKVRLVPADAATVTDGETVAYLTVPAATPDLSGTLTVSKIRTNGGRLAATLVKENVEVSGKPCTRYSVRYERRGLALIVR